jgi:hypothetical protein
MTVVSPHTHATLRLLGYSDQGGRPHGIQIMVQNDLARGWRDSGLDQRPPPPFTTRS